MSGGDRTWSSGDTVLGVSLDAPLGSHDDPSVWRAWHAEEARDVVVKVLPRDQAAPASVRILETTQGLVRRIAPPYAEGVVSSGEVGDHLVTVSRLAPGEELGHCVRRDGTWEPVRAVALLTQLAACLDALHRAGIVHGAVLPRHVRVAGEGRSETVTLVEVALRRRPAGTSAFLAPEVRSGGEPRVPSDVYGLAALLHFMVTGVHPGEPLPFPTWRDDESGRLVAVAALGLADSPDARPAGARALADAAALCLERLPREQPHEHTPSGRSTEQPHVTWELVPEYVAPASRRRRLEIRPERGRGRAVVASAPSPRAGRAAAAAVRGASSRRRRPIGLALTASSVAAAALVWAGGTSSEVEQPLRADSGATVTPSAVPPTEDLPTPMPGPATSPVEVAGVPDGPQWGTIRPGVLGPQVSAIEWLLFANDGGPRPDGVFDAPTAQLVNDQQVRAGVPVTGVVDPATWVVLTERLRPGDQGPRVRALQQLLRLDGGVEVDGSYDERTASRVAAFQRREGLAVSGRADVETWAALSRAWS